MKVLDRDDGWRGGIAIAIVLVTVAGGLNLGALLSGDSPGGGTAARAGSLPGGGTGAGVEPSSQPTSLVLGPPLYSVTFAERGLVSGAMWSVTLAGNSENSTTSTIVFTEPNGTYAFSIPPVTGYTVNVGSGAVTVFGGPATVSVTFAPPPAYVVTFSEIGLAAGTPWWVAFNGSSNGSAGAPITFNASDGTYNFTVWNVSTPDWLYVPAPSQGVVTVTGANLSVVVTFAPVQLDILTFSETGLPGGTTWYVEAFDASIGWWLANNSTGGTVGFVVPNGTYNFTIGNVSASAGFYLPTPATGTVTVDGANVTVAVEFAPATVYDLTFSETGLPGNASWSVELTFLDWTEPPESLFNVSATNDIGFRVPNGSYRFVVGSTTYWPSPGAGDARVNGGPANVPVTFTPILHNAVTFKEVGLPSGATWGVTGGSPPVLKNNTTLGVHGVIAFDAPKGTFSYAISSPPGFGVAQVSGPHYPTFSSANITSKTTLTVRFGALEQLYFNESVVSHWPGLPAGSSWNVTLTPHSRGGPPGMVGSTNGTSVHFTVPRGASFAFHVSKRSDYKVSGGKGSFSMPSRSLTKTVRFAPYTATVSFLEAGLPADSSWSVNVTGPINETLNSTSATIRFYLTNGSYAYSVPSVGTSTPTPATGTLTVTAPHGQIEDISFAQSGGTPRSGPAIPGAGTLVGPTTTVTVVAGRESYSA